ncbi:cytochrome c peroxidase [Hymenobacter wooponensis]|uniref:Di-haem cytochrome c peroxidase domain-containing protein n=1 Tax=Hymenobacter wooponensis TaxID=1525360 RepID=A0A4Z0MDU4_9BACT|nr:cytochrome c peroxidase [Hymenobacter wooponensis]TGD77639.1 hypothetical protein EU557_22965 [Hymenobacter wooponensis]
MGPREVSCATCHHLSAGYADGLDLSISVNSRGRASTRRFLAPNAIPFTQRTCTTVLNAAYNGMTSDANYTPSPAPMF